MMAGTAKEDSDNAPFEWLTNFKSLQHILLPSRIVFNPSSVLPSDEETNNEHTDDSKIKLNALHVGCGTSTVGESLLLLCESVLYKDATSQQQYRMQYGHVVNVDVDNAALQSMQQRWKEFNQKPKEMGVIEWRYIDFANESTCHEALDQCYQSDEGYFDLVLDKSTFDCLLCAESEAVTGLLCEVYRALRVPSNTNDEDTELVRSGGVYVMVTFHPVSFVQDMLTNLPGAQWAVHHEIVKRQVEDVGAADSLNTTDDCIVIGYDKQSNCMVSTGIRNTPEPMIEINQQEQKSAWSSGSFEPDENYRRTISVFTCRRLPNSTASNYILDREVVRQHVEQCCDAWFRTANPMVTVKREEEISLAFAKATTSETDTLDLQQCYDILFTQAEKEHLDYEYFIQDWEAYCDEHVDITARDSMSIKVALNFLREMQ